MISFAVRADEFGDLLARRLDGLLGFPAEGVVAAGRVAETCGEERQHRFQHPRIQRAGGVVIHINGQVHPGRSLSRMVSIVLILLSRRSSSNPELRSSSRIVSVGAMLLTLISETSSWLLRPSTMAALAARPGPKY